MARRRLQQKGDLYKQGGLWKLRWREDQARANGTLVRSWSKPVDLGPAPGNAANLKALTEKEARRQAWDNWLSRLDQNQRTPQSIMTVTEFVERRFIPGHVALLKDQINHLSRLYLYVLPALGDMRLRDVRKHDVQNLVSSVLACGKSTQTALHVKNIVSGIFRYAEGEECFTGLNPAKHVRLPVMVRRETHALTVEQVQGVLELIKIEYRPLIKMAVLTSLTIGEMLGLRWRYVNLSDTWATVDGESIAPGCFLVRWMWRNGRFQKSLKADPRKRDIPLTRDLAEDLLALRAGRSAHIGPDDPVFVSSPGKPLDGHNVLNRHLKPIGRKLGMPWLNWHSLRHTTATWADRYGMTLGDRMALLGHSQAQTTMLYTHSDQERRRQFLERMSAALMPERNGRVQ